MKKILSTLVAMAMVLSLTACGGNGNSSSGEASGSTPTEKTYSVAMVTDVGGVNDQSFNQSAWEGLQSMQSKGVASKYLESAQETDYTPNLDMVSDEDHDLIWGIGFMMSGAIEDAAKRNPDKMYGIVDASYPEAEAQPNTIGVMFKAQEPSFLVGYIAGRMTETNKVGFIGGVEGDIISQFDYGYRAGVDYAARELGKKIDVEVQYANSFSDSALGKGIATKMYDSCDIIFHAAGNVGNGVIEAAVEKDKWVIGVDRDQNDLAPDNMLTSAMKRVGDAMVIVTEKLMNGEQLGGTTQVFGLADGAVGLAPTSEKNVPADILEAAHALEAKIISGEINVPYNAETFESYMAAQK